MKKPTKKPKSKKEDERENKSIADVFRKMAERDKKHQEREK